MTAERCLIWQKAEVDRLGLVWPRRKVATREVARLFLQCLVYDVLERGEALEEGISTDSLAGHVADMKLSFVAVGEREIAAAGTVATGGDDECGCANLKAKDSAEVSLTTTTYHHMFCHRKGKLGVKWNPSWAYNNFDVSHCCLALVKAGVRRAKSRCKANPRRASHSVGSSWSDIISEAVGSCLYRAWKATLTAAANRGFTASLVDHTSGKLEMLRQWHSSIEGCYCRHGPSHLERRNTARRVPRSGRCITYERELFTVGMPRSSSS